MEDWKRGRENQEGEMKRDEERKDQSQSLVEVMKVAAIISDKKGLRLRERRYKTAKQAKKRRTKNKYMLGGDGPMC